MHKRLIQLARESRLALASTILCGLLAGLTAVWQARTFSGIVGRVFLDGQGLPDLGNALGLLLLAIALRAVLTWGGTLSANAIAVRVKQDLRRRLFAHLFALGPAHARDERTGELTHAAVEGIEALDGYFSQYLPQLALAALIPLSVLVFVLPLDPLSGLVLLLTAPLIPLFMILIGRTAEALTRRQYETLSRLAAHFLDSLQGLRTLKEFGRSKGHIRTIEAADQRYRDATLGVLRVTFLSAFALELIATLSTAIVAVEVGLRLLYGRMQFPEALFLLVIAPEFYVPLRTLGLRFHAGMSGVTAAARIFEILDTPSSTADDGPRTIFRGPSSSVRRPSSIVLDDVTFTYPHENRPALRNVRLELEPGQHVALVGASGAGKTTLAHLLLRFMQPTVGSILVDGAPLASIPADAWRERIAWVPQRPHLFNDTIAANLRLAKADATEAELVESARAAHLDVFVASLPDGYDTVLGEHGARLSTGQAQRLALARAFLKDAAMLILDEPTSGLDPQTEALLEESVRRLMHGRTVLTIAHRLSTVYRADRIVVLDDGAIVESGTHAGLIAQGGMYARLVRAGAESNAPAENASSSAGPAREVGEVPPFAEDSSPSGDRAGPVVIRLLSFLNGAWSRVLASVLLGAATIASAVSLMGTSAHLISTAALHPSIADLEVAIVGVRFFGIARAVFRYLERLVSHNVTFRLLSRLRTWFYATLEPLAPARLIRYHSGDLLARAVADVGTLENFYVRAVAPPLVAVVVAVGACLFVGSYAPVLGWTLFALLLALGALSPVLTQWIGRGPGRELVARRAGLHMLLVDGIQGMADVIAFGAQAARLEQVERTGRDYARAQRASAWISGLNDGLSVFLPNLAAWAILWLAIPMVRVGDVPGGMLAALALIALASFEAVTPLPLAAQMLGSSLAAARRLFEIVDEPPQVTDAVKQDIHPSARGGLRVDRLRFTYPGRREAALDGVSFELPAGGSLAIVGPSGAGKSTLVNLLLRFWEYESGEIDLGGESLKSLAQDRVRGGMAVVSQNAYFFNTTIRENLLLASAGASQAGIETAAARAQVHEFIASLPKGYDTWIGELGVRLSGGERQRLAIARALLKDAPLLILDEPTADLDAVTEGAVLGTLFGLLKSRTTLLITHRLVGLEHFDRILVLDHGRIVEQGTHGGLLAARGLYRRMWDLQNRVLLADGGG